MRTLAVRRCAAALRQKPPPPNVLRLRGPPGACRAGRSGRGGSDPAVRGPATGSGPGGFAHPGPVPSGRSQTSDPLAGRRFERRFEAADNPFADRQTVERSRIAAQAWDAPVTGSPWPSARDCWRGETPQRREGWGCPAPSSPMPSEAWPRGGYLPSTSEERGSAPALRRTWPNCKRASDLHDRGRVRPNGDFVSGDPQSEPDTQDLPPTSAPARI